MGMQSLGDRAEEMVFLRIWGNGRGREVSRGGRERGERGREEVEDGLSLFLYLLWWWVSWCSWLVRM